MARKITVSLDNPPSSIIYLTSIELQHFEGKHCIAMFTNNVKTSWYEGKALALSARGTGIETTSGPFNFISTRRSSLSSPSYRGRLNEYQHAGVKFGIGVAPTPTFVVAAIEKGAFGLPSTTADCFAFFLIYCENKFLRSR